MTSRNQKKNPVSKILLLESVNLHFSKVIEDVPSSFCMHQLSFAPSLQSQACGIPVRSRLHHLLTGFHPLIIFSSNTSTAVHISIYSLIITFRQQFTFPFILVLTLETFHMAHNKNSTISTIGSCLTIHFPPLWYCPQYAFPFWVVHILQVSS